jgi:hypothetical protein
MVGVSKKLFSIIKLKTLRFNTYDLLGINTKEVVYF